MSSPTGIPTWATLDGVNLTIPSQGLTIRTKDQKSNRELASGRRREQVRYAGAGKPQKIKKSSFVLHYYHLPPEWYDRIESLMAMTGEHRLVFSWKFQHLSYLCDGSRSEFYLPWEVAVHTLTPPQGLAAATFEPVVEVWTRTDETDAYTEGSALTYSAKDQSTYDAGTPASGEVWFLNNQGKQFKLNSAPASGSKVIARVVPVFEVFTDDANDRQYQGRCREPRDIVLVEK